MSELTDRCFDCGTEYVPFTVENGRCPDCGSPATPIVGSPTVLDVRPLASVDADEVPGDDAIEVVVRDDTDRLIVYGFAVPAAGQSVAVAITFEDATIRRGDEHWDAIEGPDVVAEAVADSVGCRPGPPPRAHSDRSE
ncbi:hypothetical protein L593_11455 [Salinarchaeum sp. Harcht-Bsk1]|uniref:hypothetical protein n=1 Tax=Salinarchaeum sp. Harcht-Bsk1 TaxID=1333523 RepID=UPI0003423EB5|nr:hypothetical protein [Salinarchaeum sp. Harcht-Bsk1]AGN02236.1 hypothetical protein L593_11455 [Salinarchaeum sp. Harcht-Bsk1]